VKLELSASKKWVNRSLHITEEVIFAVIDLDKAETYPRNFVCLLPKTIRVDPESSSKFVEIYGETSKQVAVKLLTNALRRERDPKIKGEIEKRLKAYQPKPAVKVKCIDCGCFFDPKNRGRYIQKMCQPCRMKHHYSS
jgi:hypothetical protein